jgi:hypothetical protein
MKKNCTLIAILLLTVTSISQKSNTTIGKKEFEMSLFYFGDRENSNIGIGRGQHLVGAQVVRRWTWKNYTKVGAGSLAGVINNDPIYESDVAAYGALFGDITQFIGKRQKWSVTGQAGHGIFKRKRELETSSYKQINKHIAGMYYSISFGYRSIISKKILLVVSPVYTFRNFRQKTTTYFYSPSSVEEYKLINKYSGPGIKFGLVF